LELIFKNIRIEATIPIIKNVSFNTTLSGDRRPIIPKTAVANQ
jgi:hypothetical protein